MNDEPFTVNLYNQPNDVNFRLMIEDSKLSIGTENRYILYQLALAPLLSPNPSQAFNHILDTIPASREEAFQHVVLDNGLGAFWYEALQAYPGRTGFRPDFIKKLRTTSLKYIARYLGQQHALQKINDIFESKNIPHAVFKGAHTREFIYKNPDVRPACDIDILISGSNKIKAIRALIAEGFTFHPAAQNISHEAGLTSKNGTVDLHWNILRPGRTRIDVTEMLLESKQKYSTHWGLDDTATFFLMLVHPVFSEYATTPYSSLMRVVDMVKWVQYRKPDWEKVILLLETTGLKTAAWVMLAWLEELTEYFQPPDHIAKRLKPGPLRARYLHRWIRKDYSTRLRNNPLVVQAFFTLPVLDAWQDVFRAVGSLIGEKRTAAAKLAALQNKITD